jgi:hypothetical protein
MWNADIFRGFIGFRGRYGSGGRAAQFMTIFLTRPFEANGNSGRHNSEMACQLKALPRDRQHSELPDHIG